MLTANAMAEHVSASLGAGADRHLAKSITFETLAAAIDASLEGAGNEPPFDEFAGGDLSLRREASV